MVKLTQTDRVLKNTYQDTVRRKMARPAVSGVLGVEDLGKDGVPEAAGQKHCNLACCGQMKHFEY